MASKWTYDVFLSFRGEDTRHNFTLDLYNALEGAGIRTFKDDEKLNKGEKISEELKKAITESKLSIIIFSPRYSDSRWCLEELALIMESRGKPADRKVFPVFLEGVNPSEVRSQTGSFGEPFGNLEKRHGSATVNRWKSALSEAGNLSGWSLGSHSEEQNAIQEILKEMKKALSFDWSKVNYDFSKVNWDQVFSGFDWSVVDWSKVRYE